jgi:gas vesicle protein
MASEYDGSKVVWFLTGVAVGAAIALLYAPQSGHDTRKYIRKKAEEGRGALTDAGKDILDSGREVYDKGRKIAEEAGDFLERGRKVITG